MVTFALKHRLNNMMMKNIFFLCVFLFIGFQAKAQNQPTKYKDAFLKSLQIRRVVLDEKKNQPLQMLPVLLINAWRNGAIQGRQAFVPEEKMNFAQAANRYRIKTKQGDVLGEKFNCCNQVLNNQELLKKVNDWYAGSYTGFETFFEIIGENIFDKNSGMEVFKPQFIRLMYVNPQHPSDFEASVMFDYNEIVPLLHAAKAKNRNNDAAQLSYRQVLDLQDYHFFLTRVSGRKLLTLDEANKMRQKSIHTEQEEFKNEKQHTIADFGNFY